jgi:hypothetical protein
LPARPIVSQQDFADAIRLLGSGFPTKSTADWTAFLDRVQKFGGNERGCVPVGYLMFANDEPSGVIITPASFRTRADGERALVINLSSWYVEPRDRWRATRMLRSLLGRHTAMFTDLTPSREVQAMLPEFGFLPINTGVLVTALPWEAALPLRGASVVALAQSSVTLSDTLRETLETHEAAGCLSAILEHPTGTTVLLFRKCRLRGITAAVLIYCSDLEQFQTVFPAVARFLVRNGVALLISDDVGLPVRTSQIRRPRGLKFVLPGAGLEHDPKITDHTGSELAFLDIFS